jgi:ketosteroid isomerase-like protein
MRNTAASLLFLSLLLSIPCAKSASVQSREELSLQIRKAETAFAKTMAARDYATFTSFIAEDAVFIASREVFRGKAAVIRGWKSYFEGAQAPFSWEPAIVEVLDSGNLALTSGPVHDPQGRQTGTFNSIWRREADGKWKVVFDKGCPACECPGS